MTNPLYPYDDVITRDGLLWAVSRQGDKLKAVISFEDPSPRFIDLMSPDNINFVMRSRLCQLGLDCEFDSLDTQLFNRNKLECTITIHAAADTQIAQRAAHYLLNCRERLAIGKLFIRHEDRRVEYESILQNIFATNPPLIEVGDIQQGDSDMIIVPIDPIVYSYTETDLPSDDQIAFLLNQGSRKDLDFFRRQVRSKLPLEVKPRSWVLTQLPLFVVHEHFAVIEGITYQNSIVKNLHHASASLFDPLSYKSVNTRPMVEVHNHSDDALAFDGVAIRFYRPSKRRLSIQVPSNLRLSEMLDPAAKLADKMDASLEGTILENGKRIRHAAFLVDAAEIDKIESHKNTTIENAGNRDIRGCAEYDILEEIRNGHIKARGFLLSYYFPRWDIASKIEMCKDKIEAVIFRKPSQKNDPFFSEYDVVRLKFLHNLGIRVIWMRYDGPHVYVTRDDCGFFTRDNLIQRFRDATFFACYGSASQVSKKIIKQLPEFFSELRDLFGEIGVVTGGGPGLMEAVNRSADQLGILSASCCLSTEFAESPQTMNRYSNVFMFFNEYCRHVRQKNFYIARFPIFFPGGVGTLEEIGIELCNLKLRVRDNAPYIFVGKDYWSNIKGFLNTAADAKMLPQRIADNVFLVDDLAEAIQIYKDFLNNPLPV